MSRIGKQLIEIPSGVSVEQENGKVTVNGPKGTLVRGFLPEVSFEISDNTVTCHPEGDSVKHRSLWGTYASHLKNMVTGVTHGFEKKLIIEGIGFKASLQGSDKLVLDLGFSHSVIVDIPEGLSVTVEKNVVTISGIDKEAVGKLAARIRSFKKTEPYKGKGIRYEGEVVLRKQGKKTSS